MTGCSSTSKNKPIVVSPTSQSVDYRHPNGHHPDAHH